MKYVCKGQNGVAKLLTATFGILAVLCVSFALADIWYKSIFELLAMAFTVTAIQIAQRNILSQYEYILDCDADLLKYNRLTVIRIVGKRRTSIYTIPLSSLKSVVPYKRMGKIEKEMGKKAKKHSFCADIFPKESVVLIFEYDGEAVLIRLQCGEEFKKELEKRAGF